MLYDELRRVAGGLMRSAHTLQATALVHEVWLKLVDAPEGQWEGRGHFLRVASRAIRNLLVDHARARGTAKRGGGKERQALDEMVAVYEDRGIDLVALNTAVADLGEMDEQLARLVELRFFGGLENRETAEGREQRLAAADAQDAEFGALVRSLLHAHEASGDALEPPTSAKLGLHATSTTNPRVRCVPQLIDVLPTLVQPLDLPFSPSDQAQFSGMNLLGGGPERRYVFSQRVMRERAWATFAGSLRHRSPSQPSVHPAQVQRPDQNGPR